MDQDEILLDAEERMEKAVNVLMNSLKGIRTGRANPGLVDSVRVEYYGSPTPLKQIANISVIDGSTFPTSIGANPQLSIYAMAAKQATHLAERLRP